VPMSCCGGGGCSCSCSRCVLFADRASEELRKKGLSAASKKASRSATEGLVGLASIDQCSAIVEINSETDFVARNTLFTSVVSKAAKALLDSRDSVSPIGTEIGSETLGLLPMDGTQTIQEAVQEIAGSVRENIRLRRGFLLKSTSSDDGIVGTYLHASAGPHVGRIAAAVLLEAPHGGLKELDKEQRKVLADMAHKLAMHVVGTVPKYLDRSQVPQAALDKERDLLIEQASKTGKPAAIIEKMVQGRLNKFYQDVCLLEQPFVMEEKKTVSEIVTDLGRTLDVGIALSAFQRIQLGEGLEDPESAKDFAAEVSDTLAMH